MEKILEYKIIKAGNSAFVENAVNKKLKEGWTLHGSTIVAPNENGLVFMQAVIKFENNKSEQNK